MHAFTHTSAATSTAQPLANAGLRPARAGTDVRTPIRLGLIGLGWVGMHRHLPTIAQTPGLKLIGVADARPGRASEVARRHQLLSADRTGPVDQISWIDQVDAVVIATPPDSHETLMDQALALGLHVLSEKPFGLNDTAIRQVMARAQATERTLAIVHNFQFARSMQALKADLASGKLGAIRAVCGTQMSNPRRRLPSWYDTLPLGLFYDESPHLLYLLRCVAGELNLRDAQVQPSTLGLQTPAHVFASFDAASGITTTLSMNFEAPVSEWFLQVHGEHGLGLVDVFRDIYIRLPNDGEHVTRTVLRTSLAATWQHWQQHLVSGWGHLTQTLRYGNDEVYRRFAQAVRNGQPPSDIDAASARNIMLLQQAIVAHADRR